MYLIKNIRQFKIVFSQFLILFFCCFNHINAQWQQASGPYGGTIYCFANSGSAIFVGTTNGVFSSTNNGSSWTAMNSGITNKTVKSIAIIGTNMFAGTSKGGVYHSSDNGANWAAVNNGLTDLKITSLAVNGSSLFAGTETGGVFLSSDNGANWNVVNTGLDDLNITAIATSGLGTTVFAGTGM